MTATMFPLQMETETQITIKQKLKSNALCVLLPGSVSYAGELERVVMHVVEQVSTVNSVKELENIAKPVTAKALAQIVMVLEGLVLDAMELVRVRIVTGLVIAKLAMVLGGRSVASVMGEGVYIT